MNLQRNWGGRTLAVKAEKKCVHIFGNEGSSEMWNYRSFAVKAEGKCGCGTSNIWQWRQSVSEEADLQIFGSQDWAEMQKRNCKSLEVAEMKGGSGISNLWKSWQNKCGKWNFISLPVKAERKCGSRSSHIWQSRQSGSTEAELHIFDSQFKTKVRTWNFRSLAIKTEWKRNCLPRVPFVNCRQFMYLVISLLVLRAGYGIWLYQFLIIAYRFTFQIFGSQGRAEVRSGTSGLWQSRQSRSVEAEFQIFSRQDRAKVLKQHCRSLTVQSSWTCGSRS